MPKQTLQDAIHEWQADEGQTEATMLTGQLEVIADELRTANLIAYFALDNFGGGRQMPSDILDAIRERLGLA